MNIDLQTTSMVAWLTRNVPHAWPPLAAVKAFLTFAAGGARATHLSKEQFLDMAAEIYDGYQITRKSETPS